MLVPQEPGNIQTVCNDVYVSPGGVNYPQEPGNLNGTVATNHPVHLSQQIISTQRGRKDHPNGNDTHYHHNTPGGVSDPQEPGNMRSSCTSDNSPDQSLNKIDEVDIPPLGEVLQGHQNHRECHFLPSFEEKALQEHAHRIKTFWPEPTKHAKVMFPQFCDLYDRVKSFAAPNAVGARITLDSGLHLEQWEARLATYHDKEICAYLRYGWPVGYSADSPPVSVNRNHPSGEAFKSHVQDFLQTECAYGAMLGPFKELPFTPWVRMSPVMSRPKKDTNKRRIIIDLTYPEGSGVNSGIDIHSILGRDISYKLPSIWDLVAYLQTIGPGAWIWVADLQRAYRQLRVDPIDTPLLGLALDGAIYLDLCPAFGCRSSSAACQRTSNAVAYLMAQKGHTVYAYLDDYAGCSSSQQDAMTAYTYFRTLTDSLGLQLAADKCRPPATDVTWLGYTINTVTMQLSGP